MKRRQFIKLSLATTGTALLGRSLGFAQSLDSEAAPTYLLMIHLRFGLHPLMGLDPLLTQELASRSIDPIGIEGVATTQTPIDRSKFFAGYKDSDLIQTGNFLLGRGAEPLKSISDDFSIVTGVMMLAGNVSHDENAHYAITGRPGTTDHFAVQVGRELQRAGRITSLAVSNTTTQMGFRATSLLPSTVATWQSVSSENFKIALARAKAMDTVEFERLKNIQMSATQGMDLNRVYESKVRDLGLNTQFAIANLAATFNTGLVRTAAINIDLNVDTHNNHVVQQVNGQREGWTAVKDTINFLKSVECTDPRSKGRSLFDQTVLLVTTDFARTSWQESIDGTGHNPYSNSFLLAGHGIKHGRKLGASTVLSPNWFRNSDGLSRLMGLPYDFNRQRPLTLQDMLHLSPSGAERTLESNQARMRLDCTTGNSGCVDFISPGNVLRTVAEAMRVNPPQEVQQYRPLHEVLK